MPGQSFVDQLFLTAMPIFGDLGFGEQSFRAQHVVFCSAGQVIPGEPGISVVLNINEY
jgi:hypothetical protein